MMCLAWWLWAIHSLYYSSWWLIHSAFYLQQWRETAAMLDCSLSMSNLDATLAFFEGSLQSRGPRLKESMNQLDWKNYQFARNLQDLHKWDCVEVLWQSPMGRELDSTLRGCLRYLCWLFTKRRIRKNLYYRRRCFLESMRLCRTLSGANVALLLRKPCSLFYWIELGIVNGQRSTFFF